jgi:uncharacterized membrane protein YebE (DUF533 family)
MREDIEMDAEKTYLKNLASRLALNESTVQQIQAHFTTNERE